MDRYPGSCTLCDALVHVLALVQVDHQVKAKTRPWQRRHPVARVIALCVQLAVEREAVAIRGAGNAQKVLRRCAVSAPEGACLDEVSKLMTNLLSVWFIHVHVVVEEQVFSVD